MGLEFLLSPEFTEQLELIVLASVIGFGATHIVKPFVKTRDREKNKSVVRLIAVLFGALVGFTLGCDWNDIWWGAAAGVLNAWVVAIVKKKLEDRYGVKLDHQGKEVQADSTYTQEQDAAPSKKPNS